MAAEYPIDKDELATAREAYFKAKEGLHAGGPSRESGPNDAKKAASAQWEK